MSDFRTIADVAEAYPEIRDPGTLSAVMDYADEAGVPELALTPAFVESALAAVMRDRGTVTQEERQFAREAPQREAQAAEEQRQRDEEKAERQARAEEYWRDIAPGSPFAGEFSDEDHARLRELTELQGGTSPVPPEIEAERQEILARYPDTRPLDLESAESVETPVDPPSWTDGMHLGGNPFDEASDAPAQVVVNEAGEMVGYRDPDGRMFLEAPEKATPSDRSADSERKVLGSASAAQQAASLSPADDDDSKGPFHIPEDRWRAVVGGQKVKPEAIANGRQPTAEDVAEGA